VNNLKLLKDKKNELVEVNKEFLAETLNGSALLHEALSTFIDDKLKKESIEGVIKTERKCDVLKEKYTQVLFRDKRALPFLVQDRYNILMMIDSVNDKMEFFARFLNVYPFKLYKEIKDEFRALCSACGQSVEQLVDCAILIETDFDGAYKKTFEIEERKREARTAKFNLLDKLYKMKDDPTKVNLTSKLVSYIYDIVSWVEETSDYLRGLIIRYPSR
jgi:predicted phosphate transport protein (TIGR00153 family)